MRNFEILLLYHWAQRLSPKKKAVTFEACGEKKLRREKVLGKFELKKYLGFHFVRVTKGSHGEDVYSFQDVCHAMQSTNPTNPVIGS